MKRQPSVCFETFEQMLAAGYVPVNPRERGVIDRSGANSYGYCYERATDGQRSVDVWLSAVRNRAGSLGAFEVCWPPTVSTCPMKNPNCENDKCMSATGEVRVLPTGADSNAILCWACYKHEMAFRRDRNRELSPDCRFDLPDWSSLKVYDGGAL